MAQPKLVVPSVFVVGLLGLLGLLAVVLTL
jgi:hypothetical protein